ncbi:MAG: Type phosphodiesterase / nucleotide pyrophosphatase [Chitinophagaceae bacterium]|nr:Type phosphodiesterase / nucleotide pyrophosphatase [Chitinophagaceae bacterium]
MKTKLPGLLILFLTVTSLAAQIKKGSILRKEVPAPAADVTRPKLVVGIVVDQMRWDYLFRYYSRYQNNGFKRLLNEGFSCDNTQVNYIPPYTALGHTCVYTGSVPAIHGLSGNNFIEQATGKELYCTDDSSVKTIGSQSNAGQMSPRNLLTTTITDELRLATNFRSKVIGIGLKDRGSILPAGHTGNAAYWFDDSNGNWISSTYYMNDLPQWLKTFNQKKLPESYLKKDWNPLYSLNTYTQSTADNNAYEGRIEGAETPTLPVKTSMIYNGNLGMIRFTPYGNTLTTDMAMAAINGEQLGQGTSTDFLAVSYSATDYIGHWFGPNSVEAEDTYLRLDRDIAAFLEFLDTRIGKGNYTIFLTADHGAAHNTDFLKDHRIPSGLWDDGTTLKNLNKLLQEKYKQEQLVISLVNYQVNLNNILITKEKINIDSIKQDCITYLQKLPGVAYVVDMAQAQSVNIPERLRTRIVNGYYKERSGAIQVILKPGWFTGKIGHGTSHESPYPDDSHIPLIFMGWGINHGHLNREINMTDIAPTIAALLHIQAPNGNIGKPVEEVLKQ